MKAAVIVILSCDDSNAPPEQWEPVLPDMVPAELKDPDVMGLLVAGEMCQLGVGPWYRAVKIEDASIAIAKPAIRVAH